MAYCHNISSISKNSHCMGCAGHAPSSLAILDLFLFLRAGMEVKQRTKDPFESSAPSGHMKFIQRRINVDTSWRLYNVALTSMQRHMPAGRSASNTTKNWTKTYLWRIRHIWPQCFTSCWDLERKLCFVILHIKCWLLCVLIWRWELITVMADTSIVSGLFTL